jgi:2-keto-4-pentenoate hydratase/2-oxohepta-3-ene-1,7-dioic acid hydratase in catechol pathway
VDSADCTLLAPLPDPVQIRDFLCFEQHLKNCLDAAIQMQAAAAPDPEARREELRASGAFAVPDVFYRKPIYYIASRHCIAGPDAEVTWPHYSTVRDFELELGVVIGKAGKDIPREQAANHIFGYTIFNDLSARDEQLVVMEGKLGPGKGKDFDQGNVFGPCIVTAEEIGDPYDLTMTARVNGEQWASNSSSTITHRFEDVIAEVSRAETIRPGEIFGSGTVGTGCGLERLRFLEDGDVVELEVEKIGVLRTNIVTQ